MRDFLELLNEKRNNMSKGHKTLCDFILANPDSAAYMTAAKLGKEAGVSEPTVVRFATELGFDGYPQFQKELKQHVKTKLTAVQRINISTDKVKELPKDVLQSDIENIKATIESIDVEGFNRAVDKILCAKRIYNRRAQLLRTCGIPCILFRYAF